MPQNIEIKKSKTRGREQKRFIFRQTREEEQNRENNNRKVCFLFYFLPDEREPADFSFFNMRSGTECPFFSKRPKPTRLCKNLSPFMAEEKAKIMLQDHRMQYPAV
jgi:hypothetical protein